MSDAAARFLPPMPRLTADLPGIGGRIRQEFEDFQVEELALYEPQGDGPHTYLWIEKRGIPTMELAHRLAGALKINARDVGVAGLKDARAVTRQWVSVEHLDPARGATLEGDGWRVLKVGTHRNKLRIGHLRGNAFRIRIRGVRPDAATVARAVIDRLVTCGVPNLFGPQRFGLRGDSHLIGRAIVRGDAQALCDMLLGGPRETDPHAGRTFRTLYDAGNFRGARNALPRGHREHAAVLDGLIRSGGDVRRAGRALPKGMRRFFVSAWQSALFNEVLARRMPDLGRMMVGDLAWLHDRGAVFRVVDLDAEQPRAEHFEISPTGPLFGQRMSAPEGVPGDIEQAVLAESGMSARDLRGPAVEDLKGGRRPLRVPLAGAAIEATADGLWLGFQLPPGCYATTVLDEVMKTGDSERNGEDDDGLE
jgi:tRNA pseudouridine13 synthase